MWSIEDLLNFIRILSYRKLENPRKYSLFYRSKNHYCWSCNLLSSSQFFRKLFSHQICLSVVISSPLFYGRRFFAGHAVFHRSLRHFPQFSFRLSFPLLPFSPCATTNIWLSIPCVDHFLEMMKISIFYKIRWCLQQTRGVFIKRSPLPLSLTLFIRNFSFLFLSSSQNSRCKSSPKRSFWLVGVADKLRFGSLYLLLLFRFDDLDCSLVFVWRPERKIIEGENEYSEGQIMAEKKVEKSHSEMERWRKGGYWRGW